MKRLNHKIISEAKRLKVEWNLGGECGHMWKVLHRYIDTMNGPADLLELFKSSITGTVFENAKLTKKVYLCEFTTDLIYYNKLKLNSSRNDHWHATSHDSCNPSLGMGLLEGPRYFLKNVMRKFTEMPNNTIREQTFCCGSGASLRTEKNFEMRMRG